MNPAFLSVLLGALILLAIASLAVLVFRRLRPSADFSELAARVRTWRVIAFFFLGAMIPGRGVALAFFAFLSFLALKEYFSLIPTRRADRRVLFYAYLAIFVQFWWVYVGWYGMFAIFIPVYMFLLLPLRMVMIGETSGFLTAVGTLYWGLMTSVYSLSHLAALLLLPFPGGSVWGRRQPGGETLILYVAVLTQLNDIMQYVWGRTLGHRKVGAGLIIGVGGFFGDITVSAVKRDLHLKDSGSMLPGHGGILDRVDSLTYTAPLFFHFIRYLHY